jgi:tight adherence protein C
MPVSLPIILIIFLMATSAVGLLGILLFDRNRRLESRLKGLSSEGQPTPPSTNSGAIARAVKRTLPKVGSSLVPEDGVERSKLQARLISAGLYSPQSMAIFLGVKLVLMVLPLLLGLVAGLVGLLPTTYSLSIGACGSLLGTIGPSFWLDQQKKKRQLLLRRGLPDACDLIVICMEGGLSLAGSLKRVITELRTAHPLLTDELGIVQRQVQLGQALPESLSGFGNRCDLREILSLASSVKAAEKFGSSMVKALQNYAETLRVQRQQKAEEMAQKASTKVLFPTLLFIFPSIMIIILGPAAIQMIEVLGNLNH